MNPPPPSSVDKSPQRIAALFDDIAHGYDVMNDVMTLGLHRWWKYKACMSLKLQPGNHVLDVCTGTGDLARQLSTMVRPSGRVVGLDFSADMLAIAKQRFAAEAVIDWVQGDALTLPFEPDTFDGCLISFGLRNVADPQQALQEMARVTKPGGHIALLDTASDNKNPLFWLYFNHLMPLISQFFGQRVEAYRYLSRSTEQFDTPQQLLERLRRSGFILPAIQRMGLGSVVLLTATKPL